MQRIPFPNSPTCTKNPHEQKKRIRFFVENYDVSYIAGEAEFGRLLCYEGLCPSRCTHNLVVSATSFHEGGAEFADSYERPDKNA